MTDLPPGVDWRFARGAALGIVLGIVLWIGLIWLLGRIFGW